MQAWQKKYRVLCGLSTFSSVNICTDSKCSQHLYFTFLSATHYGKLINFSDQRNQYCKLLILILHHCLKSKYKLRTVFFPVLFLSSHFREWKQSHKIHTEDTPNAICKSFVGFSCTALNQDPYLPDTVLEKYHSPFCHFYWTKKDINIHKK